MKISRPKPFACRKFHNLTLLVAAVFAAVCMLPSCGKREKTYRIGVSQCSIDDWRTKLNDEVYREIAMHPEAEVEIRSVRDDNQGQLADIRYFIDNGFDLIAVAPNEVKFLTPVLEEAYSKGIPVLIFDREMESEKFTAHIEGDNYGIGEAAARYAAARMSPRHMNILELRGLDSSSPAQKRHEGFKSELERITNATMVSSVEAKWFGENAFAITDSVLTKHPEINVVYAHNDGMAIGASEAIRKHKLENVMVIGIDGTPEVGIPAVKDKVIDATFVYPTGGQHIIRLALAILKGEPYARHTYIPATSPIDQTNADVLMQQANDLKNESSKIPILQERIDNYHSTNRMQKQALIYIAIMLAVVFVSLLVTIKLIRRNKRYQCELQKRNLQLASEKEKQSELYEQLEQSTAAKLHFYTFVSHDLRTPLTLILEPLKKLAESEHVHSGDKGMLQIAHKNALILKRLINQILDLRKLESGKMEVQAESVELVPFVEGCLASFDSYASSHGIKLEFSSGLSRDFKVQADTLKVGRILYNLLSNALKYTPEGGVVAVSCDLPAKVNKACKSNMESMGDGDAEGGFYEIRVHDSGKGIAEADRVKIFETFYQSPSSHVGGSGVGLALSRAFAKLMGGDLVLASSSPSGSDFVLILPVKAPEFTVNSCETHGTNSEALQIVAADETNILERALLQSAAKGDNQSPAIASAAKGDGETPAIESVETGGEAEAEAKPVLLLIEDNEDIHILLRQNLKEDFSMISAKNGAEGVALAREHVPDIIISDVMMPVMDGFEVTKLLKSDVVTSHIPILMLTAMAQEQNRMEGYISGADSYLNKPFSSETLVVRLRNLLANRERMRVHYRMMGLMSVSGADAPDYNASGINESDMSLQVTDGSDGASGAEPGVNGPKSPTGLDEAFYKEFLEIVESELDNVELNIEEVASRMRLGQSQFGRKIKAITGFPPVAMIRKLRLEASKKMIAETDDTISEIAYAVGFSSPAYFTKCFQQAYGISPTEYRAMQTNIK